MVQKPIGHSFCPVSVCYLSYMESYWTSVSLFTSTRMGVWASSMPFEKLFPLFWTALASTPTSSSKQGQIVARIPSLLAFSNFPTSASRLASHQSCSPVQFEIWTRLLLELISSGCVAVLHRDFFMTPYADSLAHVFWAQISCLKGQTCTQFKWYQAQF
jgi:hypothetical protein